MDGHNVSIGQRLKNAAEDGIVLAVKYIIVIVIVVGLFNTLTNTYQMAANGMQAAIAINEYQQQGVLPKLPLEKK